MCKPENTASTTVYISVFQLYTAFFSNITSLMHRLYSNENKERLKKPFQKFDQDYPTNVRERSSASEEFPV